MRFLGLATDYDGTIAKAGKVNTATQAALEKLQRSGCKLILVTGRLLDELIDIFPFALEFDAIVAENGAVVQFNSGQIAAEHHPLILLDAPPPVAFVEALRARHVEPLIMGTVLVATEQPHRQSVEAAMQELGVEVEVILNKEAVMVLPAGITKATGLKAALESIALRPEQVVAIGDAENDIAMIELCGWGVAVANALPTVKAQEDWVTQGERGADVIELIDRILASD